MESSVKLRNYSNINGNIESMQKLMETFPVRINAMSQRRQLVLYQIKIGATSASNAGLNNRVFL